MSAGLDLVAARAGLARRMAGSDLADAGANVDIDVMEVRAGASGHAVRVAVTLTVPDAGLGDLRTIEVGTGRDPEAALAHALDSFMDVVVPPVARALTEPTSQDLELVQRQPGPGAPTRWAVFKGPPQLRSDPEVLEAFSTQIAAHDPFDALARAGTLPHFPVEHATHWVRLWVGRQGTRPVARCHIDGHPWPRAHATLEKFELPAVDRAPSHVLCFAVLRRRTDAS